jgi:site-specific DNA recombinase
MKRYIAYLRTSTENQKEEKTIELQEESLKKYIITHDLSVEDWFKDDGVSGGLENRPALLRMMKHLESHPDVEGVLIYKLDRLARDVYIQEGLIREFQRLKKVVVSTLEPDLASDDPFRKAFRQMLGVFAEFEKAMITLRMKNGRNSAVAKGGWHGGNVYGYDHGKEGELIINRKEAEVVKRIHRLKRYQKVSAGRIAEMLNSEEVPTKRKTRWHALTIRKILRNPIYKGYLRYNGNTYEGKHEAIIK